MLQKKEEVLLLQYCSQDGSLKYILIFRATKSQKQQAEKKSFVLKELIFFRKYKPQKRKLTGTNL